MTQVFDVRGAPWLWELRVAGPGGAVEYKGAMILYGLILQEISPHSIHKYTFSLDNRNWDLSLPAQYTFVFKYESTKRSDDARPIWSGEVSSSKVTVTRIAEPSDGTAAAGDSEGHEE